MRIRFTRRQKIYPIRMSVKGAMSSFFGAGGGGWKGNGGGNNNNNNNNDDDDDDNSNDNNSSRPYGLFAIISLVSNVESQNTVSTIAELTEQEKDEIILEEIEEEEEEDEEEEEVYVKPAPKPKPEGVKWGAVSSILMLLLVISGGYFFWRRSKTSSPTVTEDSLVQRTREIEISPETEQQKQETEEESTNLVKDLERKDDFFVDDRTEPTSPSAPVKPPKTEITEQPMIEEGKEAEVDSTCEVTVPVKEPQNLGEGLEFAKTTEATTKQYYEDLESKDKFFDTSPQQTE
eukprot:g6453.t1